jgi:hypothetical protein
MRLRILASFSLTLVASSCNILSGKCTYEIRSLDAAGSVSESGSELAAADLVLSEQRGSLQGQSLSWRVTGASLKGHVLSASIKDNADLSHVVVDLPIAAADLPDISAGSVGSSTGANLGGFHDIIVAGRGIVELQTDLSTRPTIQIPIDATNIGSWIRPNCS